MNTVQSLIEAAMKKHPSLVKIKTIGNITLVGGSIVSLSTTEDAALDLILVLREALPRTANLGEHRVGIHIGPATGVVLGKERVTFDIFGTSVNIASRAMSAGEGKPSDILVTDSYLKCIESEALAYTSRYAVQFEPAFESNMKGLGVVYLSRLLLHDFSRSSPSETSGSTAVVPSRVPPN
jgi:class 3 adenylate cyclase